MWAKLECDFLLNQYYGTLHQSFNNVLFMDEKVLGPSILQSFMFRPVNEPKKNHSILLPATCRVYTQLTHI